MAELFPLGMLENSGEKMVLRWKFWGLYGWQMTMPAEGLFLVECGMNAQPKSPYAVNHRLLLRGLGLLLPR